MAIEQIADTERIMGGDVLKLEISWSRKGKPIDGEVQLFRVASRGRVTCPYCGDEMRIPQFREHYYGCRDEAGEW